MPHKRTREGVTRDAFVAYMKVSTYKLLKKKCDEEYKMVSEVMRDLMRNYIKKYSS